MAKTALERAKQAFYRRRYNDVITILEPNLIQYRDSFQYYYYLGLACLHTGDVGGALSYFQRARQIRMREPDLLAAQAALFLRRGETHQAVEYYLEALEYQPQHALSKKALNYIRTRGEPERFQEMAENGKLKRFYPRPKPPLPLGKVIVFALFVLLAGAAFKLTPVFLRSAISDNRADLSALDINRGDRNDLVELGGSYRYILTEKDILRSYENARSFFQNWRDNAAQVEVNRLLYSNASVSIKQKARLLMAYFAEPGFDNLKDRYSYAEVKTDTPLYMDCFVIWRGMATNITRTENSMSFDFLVGYDTRNSLEGIVPVRFSKALDLDPERPVEVLGRVMTDNGTLILNGLSIFQSRLPLSK